MENTKKEKKINITYKNKERNAHLTSVLE